MKNRIILLGLISVVLFSCKKEERQPVTEETKTDVPEAVQTKTKECYEYVQGKDTIVAAILVENLSVSGDLVYKLFEKDKNSGKIIGTMSGDTLIADYTFMSEGKESVRQVAFLRKNKTLAEGYGESVEKDGKMVFKETKTLNFKSSLVLNEVPCK